VDTIHWSIVFVPEVSSSQNVVLPLAPDPDSLVTLFFFLFFLKPVCGLTEQ
jgi:hypothetical protein